MSFGGGVRVTGGHRVLHLQSSLAKRPKMPRDAKSRLVNPDIHKTWVLAWQCEDQCEDQLSRPLMKRWVLGV